MRDMSFNEPGGIMDERFRSGKRTEYIIAEMIRKLGNYKVEVSPLEITQDKSKVEGFKNTWDIRVDDKWIVEGKGRNEYFTSIKDFRYKDPIVDTIDGWKHKSPKPIGVVVLSLFTKKAFFIPTDSNMHWKEIKYFDPKEDSVKPIDDPTKGKKTPAYMCPQKYVLPFEDIVKYFK